MNAFKRIGLGAAVVVAGIAALWNLGALWKLLGLPHRAGAPTFELGCAVALMLAISAAGAYAIGVFTEVIAEGSPRKSMPPTMAQMPTYQPRPPRDQTTTPIPTINSDKESDAR